MAFVEIHPRYRDALAQQGLVAAGDFLRLGGVIYCGHPDRNVARLELGPPGQRFAVFLKREHRVPWRDRWASAWADYGFVSKSRRESVLLQQLADAGIGCPEVVAVGEADGSAFLLLREVADATDLGGYLAECPDPVGRARLAALLGRTLARVHGVGFDHPDLYAKHVLVSKDQPPRLHFLDWQRSQLRPEVSWARRCRDLAALDATLADCLASPRERLRCLAAYLRASPSAPPLRRVAQHIQRRSWRLQQKRRIRELRQAVPGHARQNLIWLDGEALCVTPAFAAELAGRVPSWLRLTGQSPSASEGVALDPRSDETGLSRFEVSLDNDRLGVLVRRTQRQPLAWLGGVLRRQRPTSPELAQAALLFRLQRHGIVGPQLLAVGQQQLAGRMESFLLTEAPPGTVTLAEWLRTAPGQSRRKVFGLAAQLVRRLHVAGCSLRDPSTLGVRVDGDTATVLLTAIEGVTADSRPRLAERDLRRLHDASAGLCRRTERLRVLLAYLGVARLTPEARRLARTVLRARRVSA